MKDNLVYHYTNLDAFGGIIGQDVCMWATRYERLQKHPLSYTPEILLLGKRHKYRSCHIMRRFKIVYYYATSSDTVYIRDLWDTRMNPETLRRRLK